MWSGSVRALREMNIEAFRIDYHHIVEWPCGCCHSNLIDACQWEWRERHTGSINRSTDHFPLASAWPRIDAVRVCVCVPFSRRREIFMAFWLMMMMMMMIGLTSKRKVYCCNRKPQSNCACAHTRYSALILTSFIHLNQEAGYQNLNRSLFKRKLNCFCASLLASSLGWVCF